MVSSSGCFGCCACSAARVLAHLVAVVERWIRLLDIFVHSEQLDCLLLVVWSALLLCLLCCLPCRALFFALLAELAPRLAWLFSLFCLQLWFACLDYSICINARMRRLLAPFLSRLRTYLLASNLGGVRALPHCLCHRHGPGVLVGGQRVGPGVWRQGRLTMRRCCDCPPYRVFLRLWGGV